MPSESDTCKQRFTEPKPIALAVHLDGIPADLRVLTQFGVWRFEQCTDEGSTETWWDKIPINARSGRRASSTNPLTWSTFAEAARAYQRGGFDGIAFFLNPGGGIVGVDLDKCRYRTSGAIEQWAQSIVDRLNTFTEISPSGRGLRLFVYGRLPPRDRREGRFECYERARFLTLTGQRLGDLPATIEHRQVELTTIHTEIFAARVARRNAAASSPTSGYRPHSLSDLAIIEKAGSARNGAKFNRLYSGDSDGHNSHSEADLALCSMLAFYCGPDPARIDELFRGSGLFRAKWNRADYRDSTIQRALMGRTEYYRPRHRPVAYGSGLTPAGRGSRMFRRIKDI
jgi:primase-polymerase (primpol)-like protein